MPLIEIQSVPQAAEVDRSEISRTLNAAVAEVLGCRLEAVWTTWQTIDGPYARGAEVSTEQGATFGPIVHVYHHRTPEEMERLVDAVETVLARALSIAPEDVFITSQPVAIVDRMA